MEKLSELTKVDKDKLDRELLKSYVEACKDEDFKKMIKKLDLSEDVAIKYTTKLERTSKELKNCSKCKDVLECKNAVNGCVYFPKSVGNRLNFDYVECKYKREYEKMELLKTECFSEPLSIKNASMKDIDLTDKKRKDVIKWINNFYKEYQKDKNIKGLYLHGSFGAGKSYLIAALFNELSKLNVKSIIVYYPELLRSLKESFNDDFDDRMYKLKTTELLLIDDIGAESVSPWSRDEILGTILQYRMDAKMPTFFTSNLNKDELISHLAYTKNGVDMVKPKRIIERINQLTTDMELISENRRK